MPSEFVFRTDEPDILEISPDRDVRDVALYFIKTGKIEIICEKIKNK